MAELKVVLFDLDGVLVDTQALHYRSWQRLADELGLAFDERRGDAFRGMARDECVRVLFRDYNSKPVPDHTTMEELMERKNGYYRVSLDKAGPADLVLPGAVALLEALRRERILVVVASGSKNAKDVIAHAQLDPYFDAVIDRFDVQDTKPDPTIFKVALERVHMPAHNAVGVEDAVLGVQALHGAGVKAIGVGHYVQEADLLVDKIEDLTVNAMRALLAPCL
jgi:beta-phosphoglucomutase